MGGDVEVRLSRPIGDNGRAILQSLEQRGIGVVHMSELVAMASRFGHLHPPPAVHWRDPRKS